MVDRVLIGPKGGEYGLYVSQDGVDVLTADGLLFDSRSGSGWSIATYGEGSFDTWNEADHTITHGLGYPPLVAIRWSHTITSGKSTEVYNPCWASHWKDLTPVDKAYNGGLRWYHAPISGTDPFPDNSNSIVVQNMASTWAQGLIYYGYIIFREPDYTGGRGI